MWWFAIEYSLVSSSVDQGRLSPIRAPCEAIRTPLLVLRNALSPLTIEVRDRAFHGPQMVIISDQIAQSAVNFQVGYKARHPIIQAGNDCSSMVWREIYSIPTFGGAVWREHAA